LVLFIYFKTKFWGVVAHTHNERGSRGSECPRNKTKKRSFASEKWRWSWERAIQNPWNQESLLFCSVSIYIKNR